MILLLLKIRPQPKKRMVLLEILKSVQAQTRVLTGCMACSIYEEDGDEDGILYLEQWRSSEALYRQIQSNQYLRVLEAMELGREPPEISFYEVSGQKGLELIQELRK
jgi:quinol monooxygenase YgiN